MPKWPFSNFECLFQGQILIIFGIQLNMTGSKSRKNPNWQQVKENVNWWYVQHSYACMCGVRACMALYVEWCLLFTTGLCCFVKSKCIICEDRLRLASFNTLSMRTRRSCVLCVWAFWCCGDRVFYVFCGTAHMNVNVMRLSMTAAYDETRRVAPIRNDDM